MGYILGMKRELGLNQKRNMYRYKKSIEVGGRGLSSCQGGGMGMGGAVWASSYAESYVISITQSRVSKNNNS